MNIKNEWKKLHISKNWLRINSYLRYNKKTGRILNVKHRLPNLIILGSQKSGTTSLFHYLDKHPDIAGSFPQKEAGYFMFEEWSLNFWYRKNKTLKSKEDMLKTMMYKNLCDEHYFMDASTYYTQDMNETKFNILKTISKESPKSKFLYIIRNPFQRLISNFYHLKRNGTEGHFSKIINNKRRINTCLYYDRIKPYIDKFGYDRVHILMMEDLKDHPELELEKIYKFLQIPKHHNVDYSIHNKTSPNKTSDKFDVKTYQQLYPLFKKQEQLLNNKLGIKTNWDLSQETWTYH